MFVRVFCTRRSPVGWAVTSHEQTTRNASTLVEATKLGSHHFEVASTHITYCVRLQLYPCMCCMCVRPCIVACCIQYICIYVCIYIYMYSMCICICICVCIRIRIYACMYVCMYACMFMCLQMLGSVYKPWCCLCMCTQERSCASVRLLFASFFFVLSSAGVHGL